MNFLNRIKKKILISLCDLGIKVSRKLQELAEDTSEMNEATSIENNLRRIRKQGKHL